MNNFEFDVAFSFADEGRNYVRDVVNSLAANNISVFL